jgi:hypothetical protein
MIADVGSRTLKRALALYISVYMSVYACFHDPSTGQCTCYLVPCHELSLLASCAYLQLSLEPATLRFQPQREVPRTMPTGFGIGHLLQLPLLSCLGPLLSVLHFSPILRVSGVERL